VKGGCCVITTIQEPTSSLRTLAPRLAEIGTPMIVVGDKKGPARFDLPGATFYSLDDQLALDFRLAKLLPTGHYVRKNLGYLLAFRRSPLWIFETDDDNAPKPNWDPKDARIPARMIRHRGWVNVYRCFTAANIWPRGLPLRHARDTAPAGEPEPSVYAPIQQLLADGAPDVDAAWRLSVGNEPFTFDAGPTVALAPGAWCPFNSQATWWFPAAFPLMYLPSTCTFRMTDIWRSLVAQRCLWELGHSVAFHAAEVEQERNAHDLMKDFEDEVPGYLKNEQIARTLDALTLRPGVDALTDNMIRCYEALVATGVLKPEEMQLVRAWIDDLA
jgi:hypothetical protein